jgi:superfamily II DNA or RNA helicase
MSLATRLEGYFDRAVRDRGDNYFVRDRYQVARAGDKFLSGQVYGGSVYNVYLAVDNDGDLITSCACPHFADQDVLCKHLWTMIRVAERRGYLSALAGKRRIDLFIDDAGAYEPTSDDSATELPPPPDWQAQLNALATRLSTAAASRTRSQNPNLLLWYLIDADDMKPGGVLTLRTAYRDGASQEFRAAPLAAHSLYGLADEGDRKIGSLLIGSRGQEAVSDYYYGYGEQKAHLFSLSPDWQSALLPLLCQTGRCLLACGGAPASEPLSWDDTEPWSLWLTAVRREHDYAVTGALCRGAERLPLTSELAWAGSVLFHRGKVSPVEETANAGWVSLLTGPPGLCVPHDDAGRFFSQLLNLPLLPHLDLPEELRYEEVSGVAPRPRLVLQSPTHDSGAGARFAARLSFIYDAVIVAADAPQRGLFDDARRRFLLRDEGAERAAIEAAAAAGLRPKSYTAPSPGDWTLAPTKFGAAVRALVAAGWLVESDGRLYRQPDSVRAEVRAGLDWFELDGAAEFGEASAPLPALLAALRRGVETVRLDDGSVGVLPVEWVRRYRLVAGLGRQTDGQFRFSRNQLGVLDALLAAQPEITCDDAFARARAGLRDFHGVAPLDPPPGFNGTLREYQREGLGWLHFLRRFGFGGCLADDMGLGKTVMVLALLAGCLDDERVEGRARTRRKRNAPVAPRLSLIVVPKSLVFNWVSEAAEFTPQLRVLAHTGPERATAAAAFAGYDVIVTTYGTLLSDAALFANFEFDNVVLDEAQMIKNSQTQTAKAARLLRARHRLALSGTPVENHLGELWSLFEFLNPGMLGAAGDLRLGKQAPSQETLDFLSRALRPFILRRTKEQVAKELPAKSEQVIYCELDATGRKLYDELRAHYRRALLPHLDRDNVQRSAIQILEALLRLRQAACHPGLIDAGRAAEPSAKLDLLLEQLQTVLQNGHKVLVFSQFTSFLSIVRTALDEVGIKYEYLDGQTRRRAEAVRRFQTSSEYKLFLISLKAGGLGLNLTAADYVYLLDPWWNPAVESQAIDRAHRIGQPKEVFAYRIIARDTVEEKVLQLQESKRALADAVIKADAGLLRNLRREDVELLFS